MTHSLSLTVLDPVLAVIRLPVGTGLPWWAATSSVLFFTRTADEESLVCDAANLPEELIAEKGFKALRVNGPLPFYLTGVLASLAGPLAEAGVPIFAVSTHDTDYVLVPETVLARAIGALREAGHSIGQ